MITNVLCLRIIFNLLYVVLMWKWLFAHDLLSRMQY